MPAGSRGPALAKAAVDKIAFTGSAATGRRVMMAAAAERLTPVLLELGGNDRRRRRRPRQGRRGLRVRRADAGQACISVERVYVADAVHDQFVDEVVKQVRALKVGGDDGHLGAMTSPAQIAIVKNHLDDAVAKGAKVLTGGAGAVSGRRLVPQAARIAEETGTSSVNLT